MSPATFPSVQNLVKKNNNNNKKIWPDKQHSFLLSCLHKIGECFTYIN